MATIIWNHNNNDECPGDPKDLIVKLLKELKLGEWINVQISNGDPMPLKSFTIYMKDSIKEDI